MVTLSFQAQEYLQGIKDRGGIVVCQVTADGTRYYAEGHTWPLPWGVIRALIAQGYLVANDDGLLPDHPQTYRVADPERSEAHAP